MTRDGESGGGGGGNVCDAGRGDGNGVWLLVIAVSIGVVVAVLMSVMVPTAQGGVVNGGCGGDGDIDGNAVVVSQKFNKNGTFA